MSVDATVLRIIEALYDAALDETRWPDTLQQLTELTGSQGATFWVLDGSDEPRLPTFTYVNFDPAFVREYVEHMSPLDPTVQYLVHHPHEPIVHDGLVMSERDKDRHAYFDWQRRFTDARFRMIGRVSPAPEVQAGVALHRTRKAGRYEPRDLERFKLLQRHLAQALTLGFRLGSLATFQQCTTELLDRHPAALLLLGEHGRIVYANERATALHRERDGVALSAGVLLANKQDNERLRALVAAAISDVARPDAGGAMRAHRPSGKRPYTILVSPLSRRYPALSALRPAVCVMILDADAQPVLSIGQLQSVLGLTVAEAHLAARLVTGEDLRSAARALGITYGTARTRLATIFHKTDTKRQAELMKVLLSTLSPI
jgi:DNA-binding CsgD family transcriptional regulator